MSDGWDGIVFIGHWSSKSTFGANDNDDDDDHPWVTPAPHTLSRTSPPGSRESAIIGGKLV